MNAPGFPSLLVPAGVAALVAWRFYSRVRRMVGRQQLSNVRPWITVCMFPALVVLSVIGSIARPTSLLAIAGGVAAGVCLGVYALTHTKFEQTPAGLFYTPSAHVGIGLSVLLLGRVAYRGVQVYMSNDTASAPPIAFASTPVTLLIFSMLAGYYATYAVGLLRWRRKVVGPL